VITNLGRFKQTFSAEMEVELANHILEMSKRFHGLTSKHVRALAFELAERNKLCHPFVGRMAGEDWLSNFLRRHPHLSLRSPEPTSRNRAMGFNRLAVGKFFELLSNLFQQHHFQPNRIFNMDETGVQSVPGRLPKIISRKGQKQVGKIVSYERGETVTVVCTMGPTGIFLPPFLIFPRKRMNPQLKRDLPVGSEAVAYQTGYMNKEIFLRYLTHFIEHTNPSRESPVLLIMDNHISHISLEACDIAKNNNIILLTIPPHTSHKLQPLDVSFFGPFKQRFATECDNFIINNPGSTITLFHIARLVNQALIPTQSTALASHGYQKTGIFPLNQNVFSDDDYLPAEVFEIVDLDSATCNNTGNQMVSQRHKSRKIRKLKIGLCYSFRTMKME